MTGLYTFKMFVFVDTFSDRPGVSYFILCPCCGLFAVYLLLTAVAYKILLMT